MPTRLPAFLPACWPACPAACATSHIPQPAPFPPPAPLQVSTVTTFYVSAASGIVGAVLTWIFLPDTTGLDLGEIDRMHRFMLAGQVRGRWRCRDGSRGLGSPLLWCSWHQRRHFFGRCCTAGTSNGILSIPAALLVTSACPTCLPCLQMHNYSGPAIKPRHLSLYERWAGYGELICSARQCMRAGGVLCCPSRRAHAAARMALDRQALTAPAFGHGKLSSWLAGLSPLLHSTLYCTGQLYCCRQALRPPGGCAAAQVPGGKPQQQALSDAAAVACRLVVAGSTSGHGHLAAMSTVVCICYALLFS